MPEDDGGSFDLEACSFCNHWYSSFDVGMASCKHFYHPCCITKLVEMQNCCVICKQMFDLAWWRSFGFPESQADIIDVGTPAMLTKSFDELSDMLKDSFGVSIPQSITFLFKVHLFHDFEVTQFSFGGLQMNCTLSYLL